MKFKMQKKSKGKSLSLAPNLAVALVVVIFVSLVVLLVNAFLHSSNYFKLRAVETKGFSDKSTGSYIGSEILKTNKGSNIFNIDLKAIAMQLARRYPDAKDIRVKRVPPDKVLVWVNFRKPFAMVVSIANTKHYPVDDEGYVLQNVDPGIAAVLTPLYGIDIRYDGAAFRKANPRNLKAALDMLKEVKRAKFMSQYRVTGVDASSISNLAFYIDDGLEIRIGFENYRERLDILRTTLKDTRLVKDKIKYIDLRFDGVTIGPK